MTALPEPDENTIQRPAAEAENLLSEVIASLRFYAETGYSGGECSPANRERVRRWGDPDCLRRGHAPAEVLTDVPACEGCPLRGEEAKGLAGTGSVGAKLMFVIGYPSFPAEKEKTPYAGEAGRLLARIVAAMELTPDDVYVTHIVRCRPPDGKEPAAAETQRCIRLLNHELETVAPEVVCALGGFAARVLLGSNEPLERLRGRFHERAGIRVMPTWHPEDIIEDQAKKRPVWDDIRKVMAWLNESVTAPKT